MKGGRQQADVRPAVHPVARPVAMAGTHPGPSGIRAFDDIGSPAEAGQPTDKPDEHELHKLS